MDLQWLQEKGGLVPLAAVVEREVSWTHPTTAEQPRDVDGQFLPWEFVTDTFTVRVKKLTVGDVERLLAASGKSPGRSYSATMISETVLLGDDGETRLTYEQAIQMDPTLADVLLADAVQPINPMNRRQATAKN